MPVPAYPGPNTATGNGVTTVFPYSFRILAEADLRVSLDDVVKTLTTHYTISGVGDSSGGNVTFLTAPTNGADVVIERSRAYTRTTDYQRNGAFDEQTVDADFDAAIMLIQQLREITRRMPQLAAGTTLLDLALPSPGAGEYLRWNAGGTALETVDLVGQLTGTPAVSAFMETLLDDASARAGRQTLLMHKKGSDVASAGTIDLDTATGDVIDVTGTTSITAITLSEGEERTVRFTGALTLTNGASLVLPTSADILTQAGDFATFRGYAAGVVRCTQYQPVVSLPTAFKAVTFTRDTATATGTQAVTGVGFKPRAVLILYGVSTTARVGVAFATAAAGYGLYNNHNSAADTWGLLTGGTNCIYAESGGGANYTGAVQSFDADGLTMSWTKAGSPTGTLSVTCLAFR